MDDSSPITIEKLTDEIREVALQVHNAEERKDERDVVAAAHAAVERLSRRYKDFYASLGDMERMKIDRSLGRRLTDIKRLASLLPKAVSVEGASTPDRREGAGAPGERNITGVTWSYDRLRHAPPAGATRVGGEVESWCGKCGELTTHHIVAMVGSEPKQVVCQVCNSRHTHRTESARARGSSPAAAAASENRPRTPQQVEAEKKADELRALQREMAEADNVRIFDPKERYKAGEIISHADFGRGKIETVLRSSLLVRFGTGLKSLMLR